MAFSTVVAVTTSPQNVSITNNGEYIEVMALDSAPGETISFRIDGTASSSEADDNIIVPQVQGASTRVKKKGDCTVSIVASAACNAYVSGLVV